MFGRPVWCCNKSYHIHGTVAQNALRTACMVPSMKDSAVFFFFLCFANQLDERKLQRPLFWKRSFQFLTSGSLCAFNQRCLSHLIAAWELLSFLSTRNWTMMKLILSRFTIFVLSSLGGGLICKVPGTILSKEVSVTAHETSATETTVLSLKKVTTWSLSHNKTRSAWTFSNYVFRPRYVHSGTTPSFSLPHTLNEIKSIMPISRNVHIQNTSHSRIYLTCFGHRCVVCETKQNSHRIHQSRRQFFNTLNTAPKSDISSLGGGGDFNREESPGRQTYKGGREAPVLSASASWQGRKQLPLRQLRRSW